MLRCNRCIARKCSNYWRCFGPINLYVNQNTSISPTFHKDGDISNLFSNIGEIRLKSSASVKSIRIYDSPDLVSIYDRDVEAGDITFDSTQYETVQELNRLMMYILENPDSFQIQKPTETFVENSKTMVNVSSGDFWRGLFSSSKINSVETVTSLIEQSSVMTKGVYIHGGVGCGKTHLMKLFFAALPEDLSKQNVHFHKFMLGIHKRMHSERKKHGSSLNGDSLLNLVVKDVLSDGKIICFDEFQVTGKISRLQFYSFISN